MLGLSAANAGALNINVINARKKTTALRCDLLISALLSLGFLLRAWQ
jgi:hypothetical protein